MKHLTQRGKTYYYYRRVPYYMKEYDTRGFIRISLKTDSYALAQKRVVSMDHQIEAYWQKLITTGAKHTHKEYQRAILLARQWNVTYKPIEVLEHDKLSEIHHRLEIIEKHNLEHDKETVDALLGAVPKPSLLLSETIGAFLPLVNDRLMSKSENQVRKWLNPRKKALNNLIGFLGDKPLSELTRDDMVSFRDWWIARIKRDNMTANTANKDLGHIKDVVNTLNDHLRLELDTNWLFTNLTLRDDFKRQRKPFEAQYLRNTLLKESTLKGLNQQARYFLYAMAETGARGSELVELQKENIILDHDIPHVNIHDRKDRKLKTRYSNRTIPLVGYALKAFKACPNGFTRYRDNYDALSNLINKYLKTHDLLPSSNHSVYSLRHGFQDRLTKMNAPDRVQAQLMGHKFSRPEYGDGADLKLKRQWLDKIAIDTFQD